MKRSFLFCTIAVLYILAVSSCGTGKTGTAATDPGNTGASSSAEVFNGMGGADTGLPSEKPDGMPGKTEKPLELYYTVYTAEKGDIISKIAKDHGISQDAIISVNKLRNTRSIQIGQLLKLPSLDGIMYKTKKGDTPEAIADKYGVSLEKIAMVNKITDNIVPAGSLLFLPDAKLDRVTIQEINGDLFLKPLHSGFYISSPYGWRDNPFVNERTFHNGVDMATSMGTPIYAALDGRVSATGYSVTYGNYVIIAHHSGYETLYGHMKTILASTGQYVTTSTKIGLVGNTGQSTGPHLHFTIFKNGSTLNPRSLWN